MSNREPIFNLPTSIITALAILFGIHLIRMLLPAQTDTYIVFTLSFIPARYAGLFPDTFLNNFISIISWLTYMLFHDDWTHLIMNSAGLLMFGTAVALRIGSLNFFVFSVVCGIFGALTHLVIYWQSFIPVIGASAAISGHIAGAVRFIYGAVRNDQLAQIQYNPKEVKILKISEFFKDAKLLIFVSIWITINVTFALMGYGTNENASIAWEAHLGGFFAGLLLFGLFDRQNASEPVYQNHTHTREQPPFDLKDPPHDGQKS